MSHMINPMFGKANRTTIGNHHNEIALHKYNISKIPAQTRAIAIHNISHTIKLRSVNTLFGLISSFICLPPTIKSKTKIAIAMVPFTDI